MKQNGLQQNEQPRRKSASLSNPAPLLMYLWNFVIHGYFQPRVVYQFTNYFQPRVVAPTAAPGAAGRILWDVLLRNPGTWGEGLGIF